MWVYKQTEFSPHRLYTVGHYHPDGTWISESDQDTSEQASERVAWLNGSCNKHNKELELKAKELLATLLSIIEIGKRDLTNSKYDGYFKTAKKVLKKYS